MTKNLIGVWLHNCLRYCAEKMFFQKYAHVRDCDNITNQSMRHIIEHCPLGVLMGISLQWENLHTSIKHFFCSIPETTQIFPILTRHRKPFNRNRSDLFSKTWLTSQNYFHLCNWIFLVLTDWIFTYWISRI